MSNNAILGYASNSVEGFCLGGRLSIIGRPVDCVAAPSGGPVGRSIIIFSICTDVCCSCPCKSSLSEFHTLPRANKSTEDGILL